MPPATITAWSPARIIWSAICTARMLEAQTLLIVSQGTSTGRPAPIAACRAGACPAPPWSTWPMITYSPSPASPPPRSRAARITIDPSSVASLSFSPPPSLPNGVRTADKITDRLMEMSLADGGGAAERPPPSDDLRGRRLDLEPGRPDGAGVVDEIVDPRGEVVQELRLLSGRQLPVLHRLVELGLGVGDQRLLQPVDRLALRGCG